MSSLYAWNLPLSVPPVHDTTPCMDYMLAYEECLVDAVPRHMEVFHPNWPTIWPRLLTDGKLRPDLMDNPQLEKGPISSKSFRWNQPIGESVKEKLWECEEERFLYKGCLRKVLEIQNDPKTRYPFYQPEENYTRTLGRRIVTHAENRYPTDQFHAKTKDQTFEMRELWKTFVESGGQI